MKEILKGKVNWGLSELKDIRRLVSCLAAEFLGTAILVWLATSTCAGFTGNGNEVQISLTVAFAVSTLVQSLGHVSGCHINPCVTLGFIMVGKISALKACLYFVVQMVGALAGTMVFKVSTPEGLRGVGLCSNRLNSEAGVTAVQALAVEAVLTFTLVLTILAASDRHRHPQSSTSAPLIIGLAVAADFLMGLQYSGVGLNPARSFGPAFLAGFWDNHWIYWVGPLVGAATAGCLYRNCFKAQKPTQILASVSIQHRL